MTMDENKHRELVELAVEAKRHLFVKLTGEEKEKAIMALDNRIWGFETPQAVEEAAALPPGDRSLETIDATIKQLKRPRTFDEDLPSDQEVRRYVALLRIRETEHPDAPPLFENADSSPRDNGMPFNGETNR
jgi:hypothetical protein